MKRWEVYWVEFPYEEDSTQTKLRPAIVMNDSIVYVLMLRVTSHDARMYDEFDYELIHWQAAGLKVPSVVRVGKLAQVRPDAIKDYIGTIHSDDVRNIVLLGRKRIGQ